MATQPNFLPSAFAASGDKNSIPSADPGTGAASYAQGFPVLTAIPLISGGKAPDRKDFNGILYTLSQFAVFAQAGGTFTYSNTQVYDKGALVNNGSGALYVCIAQNGPGTSAGVKALTNSSYWTLVISSADVMTGATATTAGTSGAVPAPAAGAQGKTLLGSGTWGQDPDVVAAKNAGQIGGAAYVASDNDLDNYLTAGIFYFSVLLGGLVNGPADCTYGYLTVSAVNDNGPTTQRFVQSASRMYVRTKPSGGGAWTSWVREAVDTDVMTGATSATPGKAGLVPAPAAGQQGKTLLGDGTWGQDPDVVAAKNAGQIGGAAYVASDNDLDNYLTAGIFYFSVLLGGLVNGPADCTYGYLTVSAVNDNGPTTQRFVQSASRMYVRTKPSGGGAWTSWVREAVDTDVMTGATSATPGKAGLVPAPAAGQQGKTLLGDGTWGQDPDVVAAMASSQIGTVKSVSSAITAPNADDYTSSGVYQFSGSQVQNGTNFPIATALISFLWVSASSSTAVKQLCSPVGSTLFYERYKAGTTWSAWKIAWGNSPQTGVGYGQWTAITGGSDGIAGDCKLPANGTWAYFAVQYMTLGNHEIAYATSAAGVDAGGTIIFAAATSTYSVGFAWRVS